MCPFKGRSRFRVYMKDKPTKWGFKFYECCESESGYVHQIEMFCADRRVSNRPYDVTMRMVQPLLNKGYQVFIDNYYCEPKICADLAAQGTMVCGTVRKNRVTMPRDLPELRRDGAVPLRAERKPLAVISYIANMSGVDNSDQLIAYFPMRRKSIKWWKKPFFHLLTLCTIQAMILLNKHRRARGLRKVPLDRMIKSLLLDLPVYDVAPPAAANDGPRLPNFRLQGRHFPAVIPASDSVPKPRRNCKVCYDWCCCGHNEEQASADALHVHVV
ncbi:piggyBac transposable element-derived protein 4-like [Littorina saxatilis]|uniref:piggyBac transposable element-derived protein 4-like n=1 Tax=Littorina saxatilis TaxID=31220 RepID=UPI0038B4FC2F